MKIKMLTTAAGPGGSMESGQEYDLPGSLALSLIDGGFAKAVETVKAKPESLPEKEISTLEIPERAVKPPAKAGKRK